MKFYKRDGTCYDASDPSISNQLKKNHLLSALHFNDSKDILKDDCDNIWEGTKNISLITNPSVYKNTLVISPENSVVLKNPIEIRDNCFTIEFWLQCEENNYGTTLIDRYSKGRYIELLCHEDLLAIYCPEGSFKIYSDNQNKFSNLDIYKNSIGLHHFAISYIQGNTDNDRILIEWIDGFCRAYYIGIPEMNILKGLSINIYNKSLDKNLYLSHLRVWSGVVLYNTTQSIEYYYENNKDSFYCDLQNLSIYSYMNEDNNTIPDTISYTDFISTITSNKLYKSSTRFIKDYIKPSLSFKKDIENSSIYLDFSDPNDMFKDQGNLGLKWSQSSKNVNVNYSIEDVVYTSFDNDVEFPLKALCISCDNILSIPEGYDNITYASGVIKTNSSITILSDTFTIDYFICISSKSGGKENLEDENDFAEIYYQTFPINNITISIPADKKVHHVAYVFTGNSVIVYIDGYRKSIFEVYQFNETSLDLVLENLNIQTLNPVIPDVLASPIKFSAYISYFRFRYGAIYTKEFNPGMELFEYTSINEYLGSITQYSENILNLLEYPVRSPETLYDTAKSCMDEYVFAPDYNTSKYIKYENSKLLNPEQLPTKYRNYPIITSDPVDNNPHSIIFNLNGYYRNRYIIEFYVYSTKIKLINNTTQFPFFLIKEKNNIFKFNMASDEFVSISYTSDLINLQFIKPDKMISLNNWYHFKIIRKENEISIYVNNELKRSWNDEFGYSLNNQSISLYSIEIPLSKLNDEIIFYYTGIVVSRE